MTETTNGLSPQTAEPTEGIDDVEAHGLREVAAAASIGAAVVGAGGVAMAASHTPVPKMPAIVQDVVDDSQQLARHTTEGASGLAADAKADSSQLAGHTLGATKEITSPVVSQVNRTVGDATDFAGSTVTGVQSTASRTIAGVSSTVDGVAGSAINLASGVEKTAVNTADQQVKAVTKTAGTTVGTATKTVSGVESSVLKVVSATESAVNRGWTIDVDVLGAGVGGSGTTLTPTGDVWVTSSDGTTLARTTLGHGKAAINLTALGQDRSITIHYSGDKSFAPSTLTFSLAGR